MKNTKLKYVLLGIVVAIFLAILIVLCIKQNAVTIILFLLALLGCCAYVIYFLQR